MMIFISNHYLFARKLIILSILLFFANCSYKAEEKSSEIEQSRTKFILPFQEEWTVVWGGDTQELNYHHKSRGQKYAFDFLITDKDGKTYKTDGKTNEDFYAFGKALSAPCDGEIVVAIDGIKDNKPGEKNNLYVPGNAVIIKTEKNEYVFFAHLKNNSVKVEEGQKIKKGEILGLCGNSGNSSEPHLHFHIQNIENMNKAKGLKCFFDEIIVNGEIRKNYSLIRKDKVRNK